MMGRLVIDAVGALHGGAACVASATVAAALRAGPVDRAFILASPSARRLFDVPTPRRAEIVEIEVGGGRAGRLLWLASGVQRWCRELGATHVLFLGGGGLADPEVRRAVLVQQSLPFHPEALGRLGAVQRIRMAAIEAMLRWSVSDADVVVVQTRTMRGLVARELGFEASRIRVIPVARGEAARSAGRAERFSSNGRLRLLYAGNSSAYKNVSLLPRGLDVLRTRGLSAALVATIEPGTLESNGAETEEIGHVDGDRLMAEYEKADCLVSPSLAETVCLPLVEAMSVGLPVVVADRPYAREVCEGAAVYFDPLSPESLARAVLEAAAEGPERDRRIEEGYRRAAIWSSPAAYDDLIRAVLEA